MRKEEKLGLFVEWEGQQLPTGGMLMTQGGEDSCVVGVRGSHGGLRKPGSLDLVWWEASPKVFEQGQ